MLTIDCLTFAAIKRHDEDPKMRKVQDVPFGC